MTASIALPVWSASVLVVSVVKGRVVTRPELSEAKLSQWSEEEI